MKGPSFARVYLQVRALFIPTTGGLVSPAFKQRMLKQQKSPRSPALYLLTRAFFIPDPCATALHGSIFLSAGFPVIGRAIPLAVAAEFFRRSARWLIGQSAVVAIAVVVAFAAPHVIALASGMGDSFSATSPVLLLTQLILAIALVLLITGAHMAWRYRRRLVAAQRAGVLDVGGHGSWLSGVKDHEVLADLPPAKEIFLWSLTGIDTFARRGTALFGLLPQARDIRVMLLNPRSVAMGNQGTVVDLAAGDDRLRRPALQEEIEDSIRCLESLRRAGKRVQLKLTDSVPLWKMAIVGERIWLRYCHSLEEGSSQTEYIFALQPKRPRDGFYVPFYSYFLDHWNDSRYPEYDFDTSELVYRDESGVEIKRAPFIRSARWRRTERRVLRAYSVPLGSSLSPLGSSLSPTRTNRVSHRPRR